MGVDGCKSYLRPDATLFTEGLTDEAVRELKNNDLMLVIGTSGVVYPAASIPQRIAELKKANIVEINPERSALTNCIEKSGGLFLQTTAGTILPQIVEQYSKEQ